MTETKLKVTGMRCEGCVANVKKALESVDGVSFVDVDLKKGSAVVEHDDGTDGATLVAAVEGAGFGAKVRHGLFS